MFSELPCHANADAKVNLAIKLLKSIGQLAHSFPMFCSSAQWDRKSEKMNNAISLGRKNGGKVDFKMIFFVCKSV